MKTWTKATGVAFTTVMLLATQASLVLARSGGGKGGSLGGSAGRSYGGSISGGGLSGGYSSGFGFPSFMPFFFFGGSSSGGSIFGGLFSLILMAVVAYLIYKAFKRLRRPGYHGSGGGKKNDYGWTGNTPVDLNGQPITNQSNKQRLSKAISFTEENMRYYTETFPRWDRAYLTGRVRQVFFWFQDAWSRQDLSDAPEYLAPSLVTKNRAEIAEMKARGERNVVREPMLNQGDIEFIHSHLSENDEHFMIMISASLIDYTVDAAGRTIAGDERYRLYFTEFWEFVWQGDKWVLSNIYQEDSLEVARLARGDDQ